MSRLTGLVSLSAMLLSAAPAPAAEPPSRDEAAAALRRATAFYHGTVATHGGYLYAYSGDLTLREGEGTADERTVWVQPPGTPAVGEAFLDAYEATDDEAHLAAARDAGGCLRLTQLQSGGWHYGGSFDPEKRKESHYRLDLDGRPLPDRVKPADKERNDGWDAWRRRTYKGNVTTLDDDVTQAAVRFLARLDKTLGFEDEGVHEAAGYALGSLLTAQYPNGGFSASYDRFQAAPPAAEAYPVVKASYPDDWPRTWTKDFTGCYVTNDELMSTLVDTFLLAAKTYDDDRYRAAAERIGGFFLLAQLPDPQPAWAQQYDRNMHPVWSRAFEPPAVSGGESQRILRALLTLHRATGDAKYLEPIPRAVAYLRGSLRPDGRLARFYELETNRPLYFTREDGRHVMTYDDRRLASGYGYVVDSKLDAIEAEYRRAKSGPPSAERPARPKATASLAAEARKVIDALDGRGAWVVQGRLDHHEVEPPSGVIDSATFAKNVRTLCRYLEATRE